MSAISRSFPGVAWLTRRRFGAIRPLGTIASSTRHIRREVARFRFGGQGEDMRWQEVRAAHPDQWLVIEALEAHSENDHRIIDQIAVIDVCADGRATMKRYGELRRQHPQRELCFVHTSMVELDIEERLWLGIRGLRAADLSGSWSASSSWRALGMVP